MHDLLAPTRTAWLRARLVREHHHTPANSWALAAAKRAWDLAVAQVREGLPRRRTLLAVPPWPDRPALTPWQVWCWQAAVDLRTGRMPPEVREDYREALDLARVIVRAMLRLEQLGLPLWCDFKRIGGYPIKVLAALARYRRETGRRDRPLEQRIRNRRRARDARIPGRRGPGEVAIDRAKASEARTLARLRKGIDVWRAEDGTPLAPYPPIERSHVALRAYIDECDAVYLECWYCETEGAAILRPKVWEARQAAFRELEALPPPAAPKPSTARPEPKQPPKASRGVLDWVGGFRGVTFELEGLRWVRQSDIPYFRQRERKIRAVAWRRDFGRRGTPLGLGGIWWGFDLAQLPRP